MPLTTLTKRARLSPGYLSFVAREMAPPSVSAVLRRSQTLDVPLMRLVVKPDTDRLTE